MSIKQLGKAFLSRRLEAQVKKLRQKHDFKIIAVVGSVGKTTTKLAIVKMLEPNVRLQHQAGNYNDRLTVPLVFFGQSEPDIYDVFGWLKVLGNNRRKLKQDYPYDLVILELGIDGPGQMQQFAYVNPDIVVVTALTDEHMAYFKTMESVAHEELLATSFSKQVLINSDDSPAAYLGNVTYKSYGLKAGDYHLTKRESDALSGQTLNLALQGKTVTLKTSLLGESGAKAVLAAVATADMYGLSSEQITKNAANIAAVPGRMQILAGVEGTTIIDDSYNASPVAVKTALDVLYQADTKQRIAVLGSMNEMGDLSPDMHHDVGSYCNPDKLAMVVTIGKDAQEYLAPAAKKRGCHVYPFMSPYDAGNFVKQQLESGAVVLIKGSQNGVFSEEAVKLLLADPEDSTKLVRQSGYWQKKKRAQFRR